jgi:transcriptional regulator with GAF, ATPase, and Fis domain
MYDPHKTNTSRARLSTGEAATVNVCRGRARATAPARNSVSPTILSQRNCRSHRVNVRVLAATNRHLEAKVAAGRLEPHHLAPDLDPRTNIVLPAQGQPTAASSQRPLADQVDDFLRQVIVDAVKAHGDNWSAAARSLGMRRANFHARAKRVGLK